jgi:hypothetical protein
LPGRSGGEGFIRWWDARFAKVIQRPSPIFLLLFCI